MTKLSKDCSYAQHANSSMHRRLTFQQLQQRLAAEYKWAFEVLKLDLAVKSHDVPMWLRYDDAIVMRPHRETMQRVSSSSHLHQLRRSPSRILQGKRVSQSLMPLRNEMVRRRSCVTEHNKVGINAQQDVGDACLTYSQLHRVRGQSLLNIWHIKS